MEIVSKKLIEKLSKIKGVENLKRLPFSVISTISSSKNPNPSWFWPEH